MALGLPEEPREIPPASPARAARRLSRLSTVFYGSISFTVTNRGRVAIDRYLKYRPRIKRV